LIGGWVGPRAILDALVKKKILSPRRESNSRTPIVRHRLKLEIIQSTEAITNSEEELKIPQIMQYNDPNK
jgi:hypothetical protein